jgi:hypothetical protein
LSFLNLARSDAMAFSAEARRSSAALPKENALLKRDFIPLSFSLTAARCFIASLPICWFAGGSDEVAGCDKGDGVFRRAGSAALAVVVPGVDAVAAVAGALVDVLDCTLPALPCL